MAVNSTTNIAIKTVRALKDNYIYLFEIAPRQWAVVDPGDAYPVLDTLESLESVGGEQTVSTLLLTHHHYDHCDGVPALLQRYPSCTVIAPAECRLATAAPCQGGQTITLATGLEFAVIATPGHTLGHVAYYGNGVLFCGDTLLVSGCGYVSEGTMAQMFASLMAFHALPDATQVYCGHEYTLKNLQFAQTVEPDNPHIAQKLSQTQDKIANQQATVPTTIGEEKLTNPFMRAQQETVVAAANRYAQQTVSKGVETFATIRQWKNNF